MRWFSESRGSAAAAAVVAVAGGARPDTIPFGAGWRWGRWLGASVGSCHLKPSVNICNLVLVLEFEMV